MKQAVAIGRVAKTGRIRRASRLRRVIAAISAAGLAVLLVACAASRPGLAPVDDISGLETQPMIALEGYRDDSDYYVRYRWGEREYFAGGSWRDRVELVESPAPQNYALPSLVPLQYRATTRWASLPPDAVELPIFGVEKWRLLRDRLLRAIVPDDGTGLALDFGHDDYFLYYDNGGVFRATRLLDKPPDYRLRGVMRFDEFMRHGRPVFDAFLAEQGINDSEFVFNTGDFGPYSLPFLYVNTDRHLLVFVRNLPQEPAAVTAVPGLKGGQAVGHFLNSHVANLVLRPVSSLYRLFFAVADTAVSTLRFDWTTGLADKPVPGLGDAAPMDLQAWERDLDKIASRPPTSGSINLLVDGASFFNRFIDEITTARETIRLQTYIFDNDDYAVKIGRLLKRRSNDGIDVKVLLDGLGTISGTMADSESQPEQHRPPASVRLFLESDSRVAVRQKTNPWFTGDHVKSTIIDDRVAFVGGMNVGREYRYDWHDLMLELRGPVVDQISREFDIAWSHAGPLGDLGFVISRALPERHDNPDQGYPLRLLLTGPGNYEIFNAQLAAIERAQSYVYLQNAYFTDDRLLRELVMARRRGVDVRVVIPMETDNGLITRSNVLAANLMLANGIRVYIYPGFSHVKAAVFDGWICVGSANFDRLSLRLNRELNIASSDPEATRQLLEELFEPDFQVSPELTGPIPERWLDHLVEIVGDYVY